MSTTGSTRPEEKPEEAVGKGPVTNCLNCDKWIPGPGPALCADCQAKGYKICEYCGQRVANDTTPYCDTCAEEILGTA